MTADCASIGFVKKKKKQNRLLGFLQIPKGSFSSLAVGIILQCLNTGATGWVLEEIQRQHCTRELHRSWHVRQWWVVGLLNKAVQFKVKAEGV